MHGDCALKWLSGVTKVPVEFERVWGYRCRMCTRHSVPYGPPPPPRILAKSFPQNHCFGWPRPRDIFFSVLHHYNIIILHLRRKLSHHVFMAKLMIPRGKRSHFGDELKISDFTGNFCHADEEIVRFGHSIPFDLTWLYYPIWFRSIHRYLECSLSDCIFGGCMFGG